MAAGAEKPPTVFWMLAMLEMKLLSKGLARWSAWKPFSVPQSHVAMPNHRQNSKEHPARCPPDAGALQLISNDLRGTFMVLGSLTFSFHAFLQAND